MRPSHMLSAPTYFFGPPICVQLPSGAMVLVSNANRPGAQPHLARLLALPIPAAGAAAAAAAADGVAFLAPSLAHNLGLAPHLWPLLHPGGSGSTSTSSPADATGSSNGLPVHGPDRVRIERYYPLEEPTKQHWLRHGVAQPGAEAADVPVAAEVHIALVRCPALAVLHQRARQSGQQQPQHVSHSEDSELPDAEPAGLGSGAASHAAAGAAEDGIAGADAQAASDDAVAALQQWFVHARRVVCPGDVLAVPRLPPGRSAGARMLPQVLPSLHAAPQPPAEAGPASSIAAAPLELLYFKVTKLVLPAAYEAAAGAAAAGQRLCQAVAVDVSSTAVKLGGGCSSGLPVGLPHYLAAAAAGSMQYSGSNGSSEGSPSGADTCAPMLGAHAAAAQAPAPLLPAVGLLQGPWRQLAQLLASVLHPGASGVPLRLAVLLHGPSGSGKSTAVAAAAAAVGCHLVPLSSHDVKAAAGAAERHTFDGLRAAFSAAAEYAPAVLLLRQFSVLGDASSHGGSASSSSHSYAARLGSVLAECIRAHDGSSSSKSGRNSSGGNSGGRNGRNGWHWGQAAGASFPAPVVLVACTASADDLPPPLRRCFTHEIALEAPDQQQRQALLHGSLRRVAAEPAWVHAAAEDGEKVAAQVAMQAAAGASAQQGLLLSGSCLEDTARHTAGLLPRELRAVAADAAAAAALQALLPAAVLQQAVGGGSGQENGGSTAHVDSSKQSAAAAPPLLTEDQLAAAVEGVRERTASEIGGLPGWPEASRTGQLVPIGVSCNAV